MGVDICPRFPQSRNYHLPSANNRLIARNTLMLYFRMMVTMVISFYTTRVVLHALGVVDYGLVNVIGSAVSMFSFLKMSLSTAASRFFNFQLGRNDSQELQRTFSMVLLLYGGLFLLLLLLSETVGIWIVRNKLVIPAERMEAATWFFHASVVTLLIGLWSVPYQAMVISHENMRLYAAASIFEAVAKLGIVFCITLGQYDRLKLYGVLLCCVTLLHLLLYKTACRIKYPETKYVAYYDNTKFKELLSFSGWNMFGAVAWMCSDIYLSLLLNAFFGPVVNAARGVALQISGGTSAFTQNFLAAVRPQIVKYWASNEKTQFAVLIRRATKTGFFLLLVLSVPVLIETEFILRIWLRQVPDHAVSFTRLIVATGLINAFSFPIVYGAQATGRIALFEGVGSGMRILILPAAWIALRMGGPPEIALLAGLAGTALCVSSRLLVFSRLTGYPLSDYAVGIVVPCALVAVCAGFVPFVVRQLMNCGWMRFGAVGMTSVLGAVAAIYYLGMDSVEQKAFAGLPARFFLDASNRLRGRSIDRD